MLKRFNTDYFVKQASQKIKACSKQQVMFNELLRRNDLLLLICLWILFDSVDWPT